MSVDNPTDPESPTASANSDEITSNRDFDTGLRLGLATALNNSDGFGERKRYDTFGWPTGIGDDADFGPDEYLALYLRNGYCRTVVDKPAFTTWRDDPIIKDSADTDEQTEFEKQVEKLSRNLDIWSYAERADRIAGIGEHGALVLGLSDVTNEDNYTQWATDAREQDFSGLDDVVTLKPILQTQIDDIDWGGPNSERWGKPEYYHIDWSDDVDAKSEGEQGPWKVHWTRVIDVPATRLLDDETKARPRSEPVLNNLIDIEKIRGAAAEIGYRSADYGLHINFDPEKVDPNAVQDGQTGDEFQKWYHGLQPQFTTVGGEVNTLGGSIPDPSPVVEVNLDEISAQTGIPKKELRGNESGEVSGAQQDEKSYFGMISERRDQYATPHIARNLIDRFGALDILPTPQGGMYKVKWPDLAELDDAEIAETENNRADTVNKVAPNGSTDLLPGGLEAALEYVETGEWPEDEDVTENALDELDGQVQAEWERLNE